MDILSWIFNTSGELNKLYAQLVTSVIETLLVVSVPTLKDLELNFFSLTLGGTFGLASKVIGFLAIILGTVVLLTPLRNHSDKVGKFVVSLFTLAAFGFLFYPCYSLLYDISQGLTKGVINLLSGTQNGSVASLNSLFEMADPGNALGLLISVSLATFFSYVTIVEAVGMRVALIIVLMMYPLLISLRSLNRFTKALFDAGNSAIVVVVLSPPLMGFFYAAPLLLRNLVPGAGTGFIRVILTLVCGIAAAVAPLVLAVFAYKKSSEVFGRLDSEVSGALDINSMPETSVKMQDSIDATFQDDHPLRDAVMDVAGDNLQNHGNLIGDIKETAVNLGATVISVYGSPAAGMAAKAAGGYFLRDQDAGGDKSSGPASEPSDPSPNNTPPERASENSGGSRE